MPKVMIFGTFDHFHPGHRFVFEQVAPYGTVHVVVAQDATVQRIKGSKPQHSFAERCATILEQYPNCIIVPSSTTGDFLAPVRSVKPDIIVLGYDQQLPPGVKESDLTMPIQRLLAFKPEIYKSSKIMQNTQL
jgi:FAD synthetase